MQRLSKCLFAAILGLSALSSAAQFVVPGQFIEGRYPTFQKEEVAERGIATITVRMMRKPSSRTIFDDGRRLIYHFDRSGELLSLQKVNPGLYGSSDTVGTTWIRRDGVLEAKAEKIGKYRRRILYDYPNDSTVYETIRVKRGMLDWQDMAKEQVVTERYKTDDKLIEIQFRGGINAKPYERTIRTFHHGRLVGEEVWLGPRARFIDEWVYEGNKIESYIHRDEDAGTTFRMSYTTEKEPQDEGEWCENGKCKEWSMVYFDNGLPKGWIIMDPETQDMEIWEFRYFYF